MVTEEVNNHALAASGWIVFENRVEAGRQLGKRLRERGFVDPLVLGLARGGITVAAAVATALNAPLDVLAVKKLRSPFSEELAIGAVCADGICFLDRGMLTGYRISDRYVERELAIRSEEARNSATKFRGGHPRADVAGRVAILVDDGIATGSTMEVAIRSVRAQNPASVVVAVPVGSEEACRRIRGEVEELICLEMPTDFWAVGQFYHDFTPVSDDEVIKLLEENRLDRLAMTRLGADSGS